MALVGEAHIIVKAITSGVERDIRNGFQNVEGIGTEAGAKLGKGYGSGFLRGLQNSKSTTAIGKLTDGFRASEDAMEGARSKFAQLMKTSHYADAAIAAVVGTIGDLGSSALSLGGTLAGAAGSFAAFGSTLISVETGMSLAKLAFGGVTQAAQKAATSGAFYGMTLEAVKNQLQKIAFEAESSALSLEGANIQLVKARKALTMTQYLPNNDLARREAVLNYKEAILNVKKASAANQQAQAAAKRKAPLQTANPYAGLTKSQAQFARYLVSIRGQMMSLKEAVASGFLPELQKAINSVMKTSLPTLKAGFAVVGSSLGTVAKTFADVFGSPANLSLLKTFFNNVASNLKPLGPILANGLTAFLNIMKAAQPLTKRFLDWVTKISDQFATWTGKNQTGITDFFNKSGDSAKKLGDIFGNIFNGLKSLINENLKPGSAGQMLLDWIKTATEGFANITGTDAQSKKAFGDKSKEAAKGTIAFFHALGGVVKLFSGIVGNPKVTEFWTTIGDKLNKAGPIFDSATNALPSVASIVGSIIDIIKTIAESKGVVTFFDVLKDGFDKLAAIVKFLGPVITLLGPAAAWIAGIAILGRLFKGLSFVIGGNIKLVQKFYKGIKAVASLSKLGKGFFGFLENNKLTNGLKSLGAKLGITFKTAKKEDDKLGTSIADTIKKTAGLNRSTTALDKAFRRMNTAIEKSNKLLQIFKTKISSATTAVNKFKSAAGLTATKLNTMKGASDGTAKKIKNIETNAKRAKTALEKLGKVRATPKVSVSGNGGKSGGGFSGGGGLGLLSRFAGGASAGAGAEVGAGAAAAAEGGALAGGSAAGPIGLAIAVGGIAIAKTVGPLVAIADKSRSAEQQLGILAKIYGGLGGKAKDAGKRINEMGQQMADNTGISKDEIDATETLLLKYPMLAKTAGTVGGAFDKTSKLSLDLSRALGTDGPTAAQNLADALSKPADALDILKDANIKVSDSEQKKYLALLKANKTADAQKTLLKDLSDSYGGTADKMATTSDKIGQKWQDLGGKIGKIFQPISDALANGLNAFLDWLMGKTPIKISNQAGIGIAGARAVVRYDPKTGKPITSHAKGSTIYPSYGGSLVRVAEAGRPERIEPLAPNGLSKRDVAIIEKLSGGVGGGVTIHVHGTPKMDVNELADVVGRKISFQLGRGKY
jgi:hypothetical protein